MFLPQNTQYLIPLESPLVPKFSKNGLTLYTDDEPLGPVIPGSNVIYQYDGGIVLAEIAQGWSQRAPSRGGAEILITSEYIYQIARYCAGCIMTWQAQPRGGKKNNEANPAVSKAEGSFLYRSVCPGGTPVGV